MSHFYGSITGTGKAPATRRGTKSTGIKTHTRGWNAGAEVRIRHSVQGDDILTIHLTGGSDNPSMSEKIFEGTLEEIYERLNA